MGLSSLLVLFLVVASETPSAWSIQVIQSDVKLDDFREGVAISGAKLLDKRLVKVVDFTICTRFKAKVLGGREGRSYLWTIAEHVDEANPVRLHCSLLNNIVLLLRVLCVITGALFGSPLCSHQLP